MNMHITPYSIPLFIGALLLVLISIDLFRDSIPSAKYLIAANIAISIYLVGYGLELGQTNAAEALFWLKVEYLGIPAISPSLLMFGLMFTGREKWLTRTNQILLFIIPILTTVFAWTNEHHAWIWREITMIPTGQYYVVDLRGGPWYWVNIIYLFGSGITGMVIMAYTHFSSPTLFRKQIRYILIGFLFPIVAQIVYTLLMLSTLPILQINWQAYAFGVSGLMISIGMRRHKLFNIGPVAYSAIFDSIDDLIVVLDSKNRVVNLNPAAAKYLQWDRSAVIGEHVRDLVSPEQLAFLRQYAEIKSIDETITFNERVFDMKVSELRQPKLRSLGRVVILRDITDRIKIEKELEYREARYRKLVEQAGDIVFLTSELGFFEYVNPKAEELTGYARDEIEGILFTELIHPDWRGEVQRFYLDQRNNEIPITTREFPIITKKGEQKWVEQVVTLLYSEGKVTGMQGVVRDVSERVQAEQALRENERRFRSLFDNTIDAIFLLNLDLTHMTMNQRAADMLGYSPEELIGRPISEIVAPEEYGEAQQRGDQLYENEILPVYERTFIRKDGSKISTEISAALVRDENGEPLYIQSAVRDISDRVRAQRALEQNERRFRSLFDNTNDAVFLIGLDLTHIAVNQQASEMLGYTTEELIGMPSSAVLALEEAEESQRRLKQLFEQEILPVYERTFIRKDGMAVPTEVSVALVRDEAGEPLYIQSVVRDISEKARARTQLRLQATALEATVNGIVITDEDGTILWVNPGFTNLTGYSLDEAVGKNPRILKSGKQSAEAYQNLWETIKAGEVWQGQLINRRKDGSLYHEEMTITPVLDDNGEVSRFIAIKQDISSRVEVEEKLRHMATHDPLTGLPNRPLLYDRLGTAIERARRNQGKFAVLFVDLDNFKLINDHAGHEQGDWILETIANQLKSVVRASDTVARWGGDEFVVILEGIEYLEKTLLRIQGAANYRLDFAGQVIEVTASIGIAIFPNDGQDVEMLLKYADLAMYLAKESGKGIYKFYSDQLQSGEL